MSSESCDSRICVSEDLRTNSCGSLYANCNCNSVARSNDRITYNWNRLRLSVSNADPLTLTSTETSRSTKQQLQLRSRPRREYNSFSHPDTNVIFTKLPASNFETMTFQDWDRELSRRLLQQTVDHEKSLRIDTEICYGRNKIDGAQQFFAQSGILGPTNYRDSSELIRKTSRIHIDPTLREQIRKTSLCLRTKPQVGPEKSSGAWQLQETTNLKNSDGSDLLISLQDQVYTLRGVIEHGETKIIMLRTEISKMKRILQEMTQSHALCLFCQPEVGCIES